MDAYEIGDEFAGDGADVLDCQVVELGANTDCELELLWPGADNGFDGERFDAIAIPSPVISLVAGTQHNTEPIEVNDADNDDVGEEEEASGNPLQSIYIPLIVK